MTNPTVVDIIQKGISIWNNSDDFLRWLSSPSPFLGGKKPDDLMIDDEGRELVYNVLLKIEYGVYT